MKFIKQSFEILEQEIPVRKPDDLDGSHFREQYMENMLKHIERCARICYKSEGKITENSYKTFVQRMIDSGHTSTLEHGVVYLQVSGSDDDIRTRYLVNKYSINEDNYETGYQYVTTNFRIIIEHHWEDDLQYLCEPTKYHEKRYTVLLHSCIHVYKDLTRHRKMSFSIESTRYCNYLRDKFGAELKFVLPSWLSSDTYEGLNEDERIFWRSLEHAEFDYMRLIQKGWQPQQAAEILPQCTAADVVMSGYTSDWDFVFKLRTDIAATGQPHPLVKEIMNPLYNAFKEHGYI